MSKKENCKLIPRIELIIEVYDKDGKLIDKKEKEDDLVVKPIRTLLASILRKDSSVFESLVDEGGTARAIRVFSEIQTYIFCFETTSGDLRGLTGVKSAIGSDSTAPTFLDYGLKVKVAEATEQTLLGEWLADNTYRITYRTSISVATAVTICESGLFFRLRADTAYYWFMLSRDVFTAISVPAGGGVTVTYVITV